MKSILSILSVFAAALTVVDAAPRTLFQAKVAGEAVLSQKLGKPVLLKSVPLQCVDGSVQASSLLRSQTLSVNADDMFSSANAPFYLFNGADGNSFVLVSGSDLLPAVIGYGMDCSLPDDLSAWPQNLVSWLDYVKSVEDVVENDPSLSVAAANVSSSRSVQSIAPLLTSKWGQGWPYNEQCPQVNGTRSVTGCMATSISQVLNYHRYPTQPTGSYSYYDSKKNRRSINYANISFDYDQMLDSYTQSNSTETQQQEVAELLMAVGFGVGMDYDVSGSGALDFMAPRAFVQNFGCTKAAMLSREYYSLDEWNDILQSELSASRPVVFNGFSSSGGHSFVLDGVDEEGMYHVDWGWNGSGNGYYDVSILNPEIRGTGTSESSDGFYSDQSIFVGVCNPADNPKYYTQVVSTSKQVSVSKSSTTKGQAVTLSAKALNNGAVDFKGKVGVVLYKEDGTFVERTMSSSSITLGATLYEKKSDGNIYYQSYDERTVSYSYTIPSDLADGYYHAYLCLQPDGSEEFDLLRCVHTQFSYREFEVYDNNVSFLNSVFTPYLSVEKWEANDGEELKTGNATLKATVKNTGYESISGTYFLSLTNPSGATLDAGSSIVTIAPGKSGVVSFDVRLNLEGAWQASLKVQNACVSSKNTYDLGSNTFEVAYDPTLGSDFTVAKKLWAEGTVYNVGESTFKIALVNEGAAYDGTMQVRFYNSKTSTAKKNLIAQIENPVQFEATSSGDATIKGDLNLKSLAAAQATVYARVFYLRGTEMEPLSSSVSEITIYKYDETAIEQIADGAGGVDFSQDVVYDLTGRRIDTQTPRNKGIYFVNGRKQIVK